MEITITPVSDRAQWDTFWSTYGSEAIFQSWLWGEVQKKNGSVVDRFGVFNKKELIGIFQVVTVIAKRGSFLHIRHGPVLRTFNGDVWKEMTKFLKEKTREAGVLFFRISPLIDEEHSKFFQTVGYIAAAIHAMDAELCWVLPLEKSLEELLQDMRKTTRYEIRHAEKMGVSVRQSKNPEDLKFFYDLYDTTAKRHGFVPHRGISEEFELFTQEQKALLYLGEYEGSVCAAAIILFMGNQGIYHHSASVSRGAPVSSLIQWKAIQEAKKRGMKQYNFWGIAPEGTNDHPWTGITLFKKGFGGHEKKYLHAQDYPVSPLYVFPRMIEIIRKVRKGY